MLSQNNIERFIHLSAFFISQSLMLFQNVSGALSWHAILASAYVRFCLLYVCLSLCLFAWRFQLGKQRSWCEEICMALSYNIFRIDLSASKKIINSLKCPEICLHFLCFRSVLITWWNVLQGLAKCTFSHTFTINKLQKSSKCTSLMPSDLNYCDRWRKSTNALFLFDLIGVKWMQIFFHT